MYLKLLQELKVRPNFWTSEEYFRRAGLVEKQYGGWYVIEDPSTNMVVLPPINNDYGISSYEPDFIWSDFVGYHKPEPWKSELLDLEYIYNPKNFLNMEGSDWATFRKNVRKFPVRIKEDLFYREATDEDRDEIQGVLIDWLTFRQDIIHEGDILTDYVLNGDQRKVLVGKSGIVYGVNSWDENWTLINFRYSVCRSYDFLSEYLRYRFYTDPLIIQKGKNINDGGVLDNPALKKFKDKLNPIMVREVKSWKRQ